MPPSPPDRSRPTPDRSTPDRPTPPRSPAPRSTDAGSTDPGSPDAGRRSRLFHEIDSASIPGHIGLRDYRHPGAGRPDSRPLAALLHVGFYLLLAGSLARYLDRHHAEPAAPWVVALSLALTVAYSVGLVLGHAWQEDSPGRPTPAVAGWLITVLTLWTVLVLLAPSFAWCAIPLFVGGLRTLPVRWALGIVVGVTVLAVISSARLMGDTFDPLVLIVPIAIAAVTTAVIVHMRQQAVLLRDTEHQAGRLAERQRLSMEIHDALAQGLSSQAMLLQSAERDWTTDPAAARANLALASQIATRNLTEARRLVHDLAPADLAEATLDGALAALAARENATFTTDGTPHPLPDRVQRTLLRIAQAAVANAREHAAPTRVVLTLTYLDDQIVLDVADDGRGFDPARPAPTATTRGHGLPSMRARTRSLGGELTVESAPGAGTVVSAAIPLNPGAAR